MVSSQHSCEGQGVRGGGTNVLSAPFTPARCRRAVDEVARNAVTTAEVSKLSEVSGREGRQQVLKTVDSISALADNRG